MNIFLFVELEQSVHTCRPFFTAMHCMDNVVINCTINCTCESEKHHTCCKKEAAVRVTSQQGRTQPNGIDRIERNTPELDHGTRLYP